jgi:hypothetical protein
MDFDEARRMALALPGAEEGTSYGTPAFFVRRKLFARLREDGDSLVLKCNVFERKYLLEDQPEVFHITDHYRDYPLVLVRLSAITPALLREGMEESWRIAAPKKLIAELDKRAAPG